MAERTWKDDLSELRSVLRDTYDFWQRWASDHHSKSAEGEVGVTFPGHYGDWPDEPSCWVYSYVFGPSRTHDFDTVAEALTAVKTWSAREMERYERCASAGCEGWVESDGGWSDPEAYCNDCRSSS